MTEVFVGRQPVLDRNGETVGYELLYRGTSSAREANVVDGDAASAQVMLNAVTDFGFDRLVGDKIAFFNLTESYLVDPSIVEYLPAERVVLEVLEDVEPTEDVVSGLTHLCSLGYRIALDDYVVGGPASGLMGFASIVKYDWSEVNQSELADHIAADHAGGRIAVVERVETQEDYAAARKAGADWFQGYYFARPATISTATISPNSLSLVQLLALTNRPDATMADVVDALSRDVAMSLKVLRYVNSAAFTPQAHINSIQTAAVFVGQARLRSWTALALLSSFDDKPTEVVMVALTRAKFCELVARERRLASPDSFYAVGMLSMLETMTDTPMSVISDQIALGDDIRSALLGDDGELSCVLRQAMAVENAMAAADMDAIGALTLSSYQYAMAWATEIVNSNPV